MSFSRKPVDPPLAAEGGLEVPRIDSSDPYRTLDELMVVVEALCPQWPSRGTFARQEKMPL